MGLAQGLFLTGRAGPVLLPHVKDKVLETQRKSP